ncbi:DUF927 domain-containing protein [Azonexus sp. IMCC34842]|uniref:TOPRIM and DUF927 domain-containing protein n=1 Tax=Azonexus sp. IMCC34842 TaxID=3420950 RepID=UPI003D128258
MTVAYNELHEVDRAIDALLSQQCPGDFDSWWKLMGDAIAEGVPKGTIRTWSESGDNFDERAFESQYSSLSNRPSTGRTGMLFKKARTAGWVDRNPGKRPSAADLEAQKKLAADVEAKAASAKAKRHADAEKRVEKLLEGTGAPSPDLPQLRGKKVGVHGDLRFLPEFELRYVDEKTGKWCSHIERDVVAIPIRTERDKITSLQLLFTSKDNPTGENKYFLPGGRTAGGYFVIGRVATTTKEIDVVEGYTTGASVFEAQAVGGDSSETAVMVAFSAGNLEAVAKGIRQKLGDDVKIIFGADNDQWKERNTGVEAAKAAARAVGGYVAIPPFEPKDQTGVDDEGRPTGPTDWNDWHKMQGLKSVAYHIRNASKVDPSKADAELTPEQPEVVDSVAYAVAHTQGTALQVEQADTAAEEISENDVKRPSFACYEEFTAYGKPGLYFHSEKKEKGGEVVLTDQWICSPIYAVAATRSERGENFGLMLRFRNSAGQDREWAMPMSMLKGSGEELRGELLSLGMRIDVDGNKLLTRWLMAQIPERELTAADMIGWHGDGASRAFVLPRKTIGNQDVVFQSEHIALDEFSVRGSLHGWNQEIGRLCSGNSWLTLAVCSALAGPMLKLAGRVGVGLHFVGDSSLGKSTLLNVAGSVWGGRGFIRTWRATGNGLEGIAAALSDTCLILDEIGEAPASEVGAIVYAIGNGTGKSRAARTGAAKKVARWRLSLLSSGEKTLGTIMAEAGKTTHAGQEVRMLDIPAKRNHGVFDKLHGFLDGRTLADHLQNAAKDGHCGHLGVAFIERLMADARDFKAAHQSLIKEPGFKCSYELEGRAAESLALIALAGELATEYGLTNWSSGDAKQAAVEAFKAWREMRGEGQTEVRKILRAVETFIDRHGDSRFSPISIDHATGDAKGYETMIRDRAGWWKNDPGGRVYLFTADGLREALNGFEFNRGIDALKNEGWIAESDKDKNSKKIRIRGDAPKPFYCIRQTDDDCPIGELRR